VKPCGLLCTASSIHEVDAVLAGGRATATTNSCTGNRDKAPRGKCSQFLELIGSVAVAVPADYARYIYIYIYEPTVYLHGESGRNCQVGSAILAGEHSVPRKSEMVDPSRCTITCPPLGKCVYISLFWRSKWLKAIFLQCQSMHF
jgi:hypothetical protein